MKRQAGLSLVELVLAVALSASIMLALAAIFSNSNRWYRRTFYQNMNQGGTILSMTMISRDLGQSTMISSPGTITPVGSDILIGCTNYDPITQSYVDSTQEMRAYSYCVDNNQNMQYSMTEIIPPNPALPCNPVLGACGGNIAVAGWPAPQTTQITTSVTRDNGPSNCAGAPYFCRSQYNQVELHYFVEVANSTATVKVNTTVSTMMPGVNPF